MIKTKEQVGGKEEVDDDVGPCNVLDTFTVSDYEEVLKLINKINDVSNKDSKFEEIYEKYSNILSKYQEQPHLLDNHIGKFVEILLEYLEIYKEQEKRLYNCDIYNCVYKFLYRLSAVRTYKVFVKFLPHELSYLDYVINMLEEQRLGDVENWETRYILLLWLSILILNPFDLSRLDTYDLSATPGGDGSVEAQETMNKTKKMYRIYEICRINFEVHDSCTAVAAFLCGKYLIRKDIQKIFLNKFIDYTVDESVTANKYTALLITSSILKHGKRDDMLQFAHKLLKFTIDFSYKNENAILNYQISMKIIQRIGLLLLPPRLASWRYKRGSRSLVANLNAANKGNDSANDSSQHVNNYENITETDVDENIFVPDEIEEIIEELLKGLKKDSTKIRWSAAKGIGRITNRLPKSMGDEVVGSVVEILNPLEQADAWHGSCLALAELAKRGLLLPYRLPNLVPLLLQALCYDEIKGYMSVGQNIRDAACYMSWAFARAYNPTDLQPFVEQMAAALITTTVFDREINCRRAAAAAFQESVGRLGNFPHGIDILTEADFFSVGLRTNAFLNLSHFIANFSEYKYVLIDHLVEKKINHWDTAIRELAAKSLNRLAERAPEYMADNVLPSLLEKTDSININVRHGAVIAIGEIILALKQIVTFQLNEKLIQEITMLIAKFQNRDQFRGMSGELMKQCCTDFIKNCSAAAIPASTECIDGWQILLDKCITNKSEVIRERAVEALANLCDSYYSNSDRVEANCTLIDKYLKELDNAKYNEDERMGYALAIGSLPKFMLKPKLEKIIKELCEKSIFPEDSNPNLAITFFSASRRDCIKSLSRIVNTIGFEEDDGNDIRVYLEFLFNAFLKGLDEYVIDKHGDIGSWVREAAMTALYNLIIKCPKNLLQAQIINSAMLGLFKQGCEKIDKIRSISGKILSQLIHSPPPSEIPHIQQHSALKEIFPKDCSKIAWYFAVETIPFFCELLSLPEYSFKVMLGLVSSIGGPNILSEQIIGLLIRYLRKHPEHLERIGGDVTKSYQVAFLDKRQTITSLEFMGRILSSGAFDKLIDDENSEFTNEIYRIANMEKLLVKNIPRIYREIDIYVALVRVSNFSFSINNDSKMIHFFIF